MAFAPKGRESQRGNDTVGVPGKECSKRMKRDELSRLDRREYERLMDARRRRQKRYRRFRLFCTLLVMFVVSVILLLARKVTRKSVIPFAPFLYGGMLLASFLFGM